MHPRAATCPVTLDLASLLRWAPTLPHVPRLWTTPPCRGGLRCRHVFHSFRPRLLAEVGSGAAMCPTALGSTSSTGELWCYHVSHGLQRAVDHRNK
jgi:hypothetical protein